MKESTKLGNGMHAMGPKPEGRFGSRAALEHGEPLLMRSSPCAINGLPGTRVDCSAKSRRARRRRGQLTTQALRECPAA